jgi:hypothetical protein
MGNLSSSWTAGNDPRLFRLGVDFTDDELQEMVQVSLQIVLTYNTMQLDILVTAFVSALSPLPIVYLAEEI